MNFDYTLWNLVSNNCILITVSVFCHVHFCSCKKNRGEASGTSFGSALSPSRLPRNTSRTPRPLRQLKLQPSPDT